MADTTYAGIDYGLGRTNIDPLTGIRYGVISQHSLGEAIGDLEMQYGDPHCPDCGDDAIDLSSVSDDIDREEYEHAKHECADYACDVCQKIFGPESAFPDEPIGLAFEDDEYAIEDCLDSDVIILRSPYYTRAQYCSPCVPGAGNLDSPCESGPKTLCLGHEWFEGNQAPYRVFRISDDEEVLP